MDAVAATLQAAEFNCRGARGQETAGQVWRGYYGVFQGQEAEQGRQGVKVAKAVKVEAAERM